MSDEEMDERTREALRGYRVPPPAPLDEMWESIEARHFGTPVVSLVDREAVRGRAERRWRLGEQGERFFRARRHDRCR